LASLPELKSVRKREKKVLEKNPKKSYDLQDFVKAGALLVNDDVALSAFVGS